MWQEVGAAPLVRWSSALQQQQWSSVDDSPRAPVEELCASAIAISIE